MRRQSVVCLWILFASGIASTVQSSGDIERGISLDKALKSADVAIGFPKGRPDNYEVVTAKLIHSKHFDVSCEGLSDDLKDIKSLSPGREFWLVVYRKWPIRLDDDLIAFIDARTGETIRVYRSR